MSRVTLLTGSNLGQREVFLASALEEIARLVGPILRATPVAESEAWGYESSNIYSNQILVVDSLIDDPIELLDTLQAIELSLGRVRDPGAVGYADRTIDIDILYIEGLEVNHERLTVPHPRIAERDFVLRLLAQINLLPECNLESV